MQGARATATYPGGRTDFDASDPGSGGAIGPPRLERLRSLHHARADWQRLAAGGANPFATWEWADAWWTHSGQGATLWLWRVLDEDGRTVAILPLCRRRQGPFELARFIGHGAADQLGPICAAEDLPLAAQALREVASQLPSRGLVVAERLPGESGLAGTLGPVVRHESSPRLVAAGRSSEEWLSSRSANFRHQVRRRDRRLRRLGVDFRLADDPGRLDADMTALIALHRARWGRDGSPAFSPSREALHRDFARRALERGWLRLWLAEAADGPVAAWYGFRVGGREWYYQAGRDPAWSRHAVGFVLLAHTVRAALDDGVSEYRLGLGAEPYKTRFASDDPGLETVMLGGSWLRRVASAAVSAGRSLPPGMRRAIVHYHG